MEQSAGTANNSGGIHVIRGIFGFLLSILLIILLTVNGILLPVKTSFIKGDSIDEVLKNLNFYDMIHELVYDAFEENINDDPANKAFYELFLTGDNIDTLCDKLITAFMNDEDVDLTFMEKSLTASLKDKVNSAINNAFDEISADGHKVIDANVLASNKALNQLQNDYGMDISGIIMDAISSQYGVESIDLNYIDINSVKSFVTDSLDTTVYPEIENSISQSIEEASDSINSDIDTALNDNEVKKYMFIIETSIKGFKIVTIAILAAIAFILIIQLIMYRSCMYRAFRNFWISAIFPGLLLTGFGVIFKIAFPIAMEEVAADIDYPSLTEYINQLFKPFFGTITNIGLVYLAAFVVCLILSIILKVSYKNKNTIYY